MKKTRSLIITAFVLSVLCNAHQDCTITFSNNKLIGLPEQYQPATFDYETKQITIRTNSVVLPECIWALLGNPTQNQLFLSSSWYHDKNVLPSYLIIHTSDNQKQLWLNLESLAIIQQPWCVNVLPECLNKWEVTNVNSPLP